MALVSLQRLPEEKRQKALPAVKQGILKRCATTRVVGGKLAGRGGRRVGGFSTKKNLGGGNSNIFYFHPYLGKMNPF